ncbi:2-oxoglutarate dehydrogenase complex dihydrolipoyllysine-residue succinyltransferase, partial [Phaeospirillum tilakii]
APAPAPAPAPAAAAAPAAMPSARKIAADAGLDTAGLAGSGKGGRVTKGDVLSALAAPAVAPASGREERVKMTRLRQRIAERLKAAQNNAAMLTTFNEVDMTALFELRNRYKDGFEKKHGVKLGFMSFFVKACVAALKEWPAVNAEIDGDELIYKKYYDIGVAVGTPQGLVVPVVRGADTLSFAGVEQEIAALGKKARDGKLTMAELTGGTFTISNGGVYGSLMSTPILNPPQSGILGMHKVQQRPMVMPDGSIAARPMMYLALSYDHRIIDGREAVSFLVRVKDGIEDPSRLLLEV